MATAADILPIHMHPRTDTDGATRGASATTVGVTDGIMMVGLAATADGVMEVDGVTTMLADGAVMAVDGAAVTAADGVAVMVVDLRMAVAVMAVADTLPMPTQDMVADTIAADSNGHRISPAQSCSVTFDVHPSALS